MQIPGYRIIRKINQGGMSTVYLAIQTSVGREVALKVMSPALNADPVFSERFQREANIVGQLSHPNIVSIYDIGRFKNLNYIAMDYLPGGSVHDKMTIGLSIQEILRITREVAQALDHAHDKGYIHRDIKPENVLFREDESSVLSDFGVAKTVSSASKMTNAGTVVGTPHYMSPEQARGKAIDGRSDIYSLGVVFYEMLTGSVPFKAEEAVAIAIKHLTAPVPKLPPQYALYQGILNKLLAKDADDRYQRGRELVEALEGVESTLTGNTPRYLTSTEPTAVQVMSLFKALLLTSYAAILIQVKDLLKFIFSWRWTPKRGVYRHPETNVTEIRTEVDTNEDQRSTVISTRIQKAAYYQSASSSKHRWLSRSISLMLMLSLIWGAISVALNRFELPGEEKLPPSIYNFSIASAVFLERQGQRLFSNNDNDEIELNQPITSAEQVPALNLPESGENLLDEKTDDENTEEPKPAEPPKPPRYVFKVSAQPENALIRILNIPDKYYPGIELLPGRYHIEVSHKSYDIKDEWIELTQNTTHSVALHKTSVPGASFFNDIPNAGKGPEMIIIPAGSFTMGDKNTSNATPTRRIRFNQPFAVSKYEITFADFDKFTKAAKRKKINDKRWGRGSRPAINISWYDAKDYTRWLSKTTGKKYRLLTESEWEYIARAGSKGSFWWGNSKVKKMANCRRGCDSDYSGIFSSKTAPVGTYKNNAFGLYDTAGNAAEWVQDCYQNHYLGAPRDGSAVSSDNCPVRSVRGGSLKSNLKDLANFARSNLEPTSKQDHIGFRIMVDLY